MKKISVKLQVNTSSNYITVDYDDLDCSEEEWEAMSDEEKHQCVQEYVHELQEQPYWCVDKITED